MMQGDIRSIWVGGKFFFPFFLSGYTTRQEKMCFTLHGGVNSGDLVMLDIPKFEKNKIEEFKKCRWYKSLGK